MIDTFAGRAIDAYEHQERRIEELEAENAKLRELVRDMIAFLAVARIADVRIHSREHGTWSLDGFISRAKELGVEP